MEAHILEFLTDPTGPLHNEHSLQLELGYFLRLRGLRVEFERPFKVASHRYSTKKPKKELDLLADETAIELKMPLSGRVPETLYDFCADIEFVEALISSGHADSGFCLLLTDNHQFWTETNGQAKIYDYFRGGGITLTGAVSKPTGSKDTNVYISGEYYLANKWKNEGPWSYLLVPVDGQKSLSSRERVPPILFGGG